MVIFFVVGAMAICVCLYINIYPAFFFEGCCFLKPKGHPLSSIQRPGDFRLEPPRLQGGVGFLRSRKWILKTPKINSATKVLKQPQKGTKGNDFCEL